MARLEAATIPERAAVRSAGWLASPWVYALFGIAVALATWDPQPVVPTVGLDPSWIIGLSLAADLGLDHGTQFVFTYGPLGFLEEPLVVSGGLAFLSGIYALGLRAVLAASLLWGARRSFAFVPAALLAFAAMAIAPRATASVPLALATVWCLVALQEPGSRWAARLIVFGGGALAALETLVKLNTGIAILLMVAVTTVALTGRRLRNVLTLSAVFVVTYLLLWFASGQGLGNLGDYLRSSFEIVSGYSAAMQINAGEVPWDWLAALLVALATFAATVYASARLPIAHRVAMVAVVGLLVFSLEKFGFVRHDVGHVGAYFEGLVVVWVALRWRGVTRLIPYGALAVIAAAYFIAAKGAADFTVRPALAVDQLRTLFIPADRDQARDDARAAMQAAYDVDPRILARIGDAPVDVRPWESGLVWAYGLDWRPLPVIQDYQAYRPWLDRLNAEALASGDGPRYVLRHLGYGGSSVVGIDGRFAPFDAPLETRVLLCRFRPVLTSDNYQLLARGRDRCGEPRPLETVTAAYGDRVPVPRARANEAVFARIEGAAAQGIEGPRAQLYRAAIRRISLGPASAPLPAANAASGLLISAPSDDDFPAPFALAPDVETIAVDSEGGLATSEGPLRVEFYAVAISASR
jgi:hypothetical protein